MISVCCIKWGNRYGAEYVNRLAAGIRRCVSSVRYEFVCFTEQPEGISPDVRVLPLMCNYEGWWQKVSLFKSELYGVDSEKIFYLDLACIPVGRVDEMLEFDSDFAVCQNWPPEWEHKDKNAYASGAMLLRVGSQQQVWDTFAMHKGDHYGDQWWIERAAPGADFFPYDWTPSYKLRNLTVAGLPAEAKLIMFHGVPKPHQCKGWVEKIWTTD